jgi:hypothetical protein
MMRPRPPNGRRGRPPGGTKVNAHFKLADDAIREARLRCERAKAYNELMELLELAEMPTELMGTA